MAQVAHNFKEKSRTGDVLISEDVDFSGLLLSESVLNGLHNSGFVRPSPIQLKAIPLGRCGLDLIVQAKSGTGKTCVFSVIALESIATDTCSTQVLVLAPTREIAVQIWEVINSIGSAVSGLVCHTFIGGLPVPEDRVKLRKCHIAVGSPGRIKQLIECGALKTDSVRLFVLDEADKLLEESFQEQINWIYSTLPDNKQMLALSATYPEYLASQLTHYMRNPTYLRLNITDPALLGIRQYHQTVPYHAMAQKVFDSKSEALTHILSSISFQQCLVFSNLQTRAQNLADSLVRHGWPTACIAGRLDQKDRNEAMAKLKTYKCRILISTDLTSRGIDADKVNLVINLDVPKDHETYLHRIGRAGRFGAFGIAITLVSEGQEMLNLTALEKRCNTRINPVPDPIPSDLAKAESPVSLDDVVSTEVINTDGQQTNSEVQSGTENGTNLAYNEPRNGINKQTSGKNEPTNSNNRKTISNNGPSHLDKKETTYTDKQHTTEFSKMNGHIHGTVENKDMDNMNSTDQQGIKSMYEPAVVNKKKDNNKAVEELVKKENRTEQSKQRRPETEMIEESDSSLDCDDTRNRNEERPLSSSSIEYGADMSRDASTGFDLHLMPGSEPTSSQNQERPSDNEEASAKQDTKNLEYFIKEYTGNTERGHYNSDIFESMNFNNDCEFCINTLSLKKLQVNVPEIFKKSIQHTSIQKKYTYQTGAASLKAFCDNEEPGSDRAHLTLENMSNTNEVAKELSEAVEELKDLFDKNCRLGKHGMSRKIHQRKVKFSLSGGEEDNNVPSQNSSKKLASEGMDEKTVTPESSVQEHVGKSKPVQTVQRNKETFSQPEKIVIKPAESQNAVKKCPEKSPKKNIHQEKSKSTLQKTRVDYRGKFAIGHLLAEERGNNVKESQDSRSPSIDAESGNGMSDANIRNKVKQKFNFVPNISSSNRQMDNETFDMYKDNFLNEEETSDRVGVGNIAKPRYNATEGETDERVDLIISRNKSRHRQTSVGDVTEVAREEIQDSDVRESQHSGSEFTEDSDSDSDSLSSSEYEESVPKTRRDNHYGEHYRDKHYSEHQRDLHYGEHYRDKHHGEHYRNLHHGEYYRDKNTGEHGRDKHEEHYRDINAAHPTNHWYNTTGYDHYSMHHVHNAPSHAFNNPHHPYKDQNSTPRSNPHHDHYYNRPSSYSSQHATSHDQIYNNYSQHYPPWFPYCHPPQYPLPWQHYYNGYSYGGYPYQSYNPYVHANWANYPSHQTPDRSSSNKDNLETAYSMQREYIQQMCKFHA